MPNATPRRAKDRPDIGHAIKMARAMRGLTQKDVAKRIGVTASYLSLLESDSRDPGLNTLCNIAKVCGVKLSELIRYAEGERPSLSRAEGR